jgi:alpha-L-arabinofuranosidase
MLNAFQRQCSNLKVAAFAHPADAQPVIITPEAGPAFPTPLYFPYLLYREMEPQLLSVVHWSPVFQAEALGRNIRAYNQVSYIDLTATRSVDGRRVVLAVTNRNPHRQASVMVNLKGEDNRKFRTVAARLMAGPDPLAGPEEVGVRTVKPPKLRFTWLDLDLPPASLMVVTVEEKG